MPLQSWKRKQMAPRWAMLQREPDAFYDSIVEMMCSAMRVPVAMISIIQDSRHFVHASHGIVSGDPKAREIPISHSLCQHVVAMGRPLVVSDTLGHELVRRNPAIVEFGVAAYLGEPLHGNDGKPFGTLCVFDTRARDWAENHRRMLSITAMIVEKAMNAPKGAPDFPMN